MSIPLHTVLGASGGVGRAVTKELVGQGCHVRLVGRSVLDIHGTEFIKADGLKREEVLSAIKGSAYLYLCVGLAYDSRVWSLDWPELIQNVIEACLENNTVLVFLDNIYMYGPSPLQNPITESHPQQPNTRKGVIRRALSEMILEAIETNGLKAVIGRSADFYGPHAKNSMFYINFLDRMLKGKNPQTLLKPCIRHTYACTIDIGKALVLLARAEDTHGQVWHLPVGIPVNIEEVLALFNEVQGTSYTLSYMPPFLFKLLSLFITPLRELKEMIYQFESEYVLSCDKFKKRFPDFLPVSYKEGIREMIRSFKK